MTSSGQSLEGLDLPVPLWGHSMVMLDSSSVLIIGGKSYGSNDHSLSSTYLFDTSSNEWTPGPPLNTGRYLHGTAYLTDSGTDDRIIVVAGGKSTDGAALSTVEIMNSDMNWKQGKIVKTVFLNNVLNDPCPGPEMLLPMHSLSLVPFYNDILRLGGRTRDDYLDSIARLSCGDGQCKWSEMAAKLSVPRVGHLAIPLPHNIAKN